MKQHELAMSGRIAGTPRTLDATLREVRSRIACPANGAAVPLFRSQPSVPGLDAINADFFLTLSILHAAILDRIAAESRAMCIAGSGSIADRHNPERLADWQRALQLSCKTLKECQPTLHAAAGLHAQHATGGAATDRIGEIRDLIQRRFTPAFLSVASPADMAADFEALRDGTTALAGHVASLEMAVAASIAALHRSGLATCGTNPTNTDNPTTGDFK